jgi:glycosyltransferase involved in cell wall biosynthesis
VGISPSTLVSGLCVTSNRPAFLERAVAWWRAQQWARKELVIVDGSVPELRLDFRRFRDVRHVILEPDLEMGAKHNRAVREAQGEVLVYVDDDDWFSPRRIVKQLEPIALGRASITGIPRDLVVYTPGGSYVRFKAPEQRGRLRDWLGNGFGKGHKFLFHDGSAMWTRAAMRRGATHPPLRNGQKVVFLDSMIAAGEKWEAVPNTGLFVYVRHGANTWNYVPHAVEVPALEPSFVPQDVRAFWRKGVA